VRLAQLEMGRLVDRQLGQAAPRSFRSRARDILARVSPRAALVAGAVTALALAGAWAGLHRWPTARSPGLVSARGTEAPASERLPHPGPSLYRDLSQLYAGPDIGPPAESRAPVELTYRPATAAPLLRALAIDSLEQPSASTRRPLHAAPPAEPVGGGLEVSLLAVPEPGVLRLPVPTGHQVDAGSVRLDGQRVALFLSSLGEPVVRLPRRHRGSLRYRTQPAREVLALPAGVPKDPPDELSREAARLRSRPLAERVAAAIEWTRNRVTGSQEATVARQHATAQRRGDRFLARALTIGAGDCDVQNGVLVELLRLSGVPARLAVGYVGREGRALPWLHAWAEYQAGNDGWRAADASVSTDRGPGRTPAQAAPPADHHAGADSARAGEVRGLRTAALATLLVLLLLLLALRRTRRSMALEQNPDVARLLQGALRHPDAFREAPAVFHRPLLPLFGGGRASLLQAWTEASQDRLYSARHPGTLTRAVARHALVVDAATAEGAAVAHGLGAVDLDRWQRLLDRSHVSRPLDDVAHRLSDPRTRIRARILPSLSAPISLALPRGFRRRSREHLLLVPDHPPWNGAAGPGRSLEIAEAILDRLDAPAPRRAERLAALSRRWLLEAFPR
jgi:transglutaminase-like putative cysteine protease